MSPRIQQLSQYRPHPIVMELAIITDLDDRSLTDLYHLDGISRDAWYSWINGKRSPGLDRISVRAQTLSKQIVLASLDDIPRQGKRP